MELIKRRVACTFGSCNNTLPKACLGHPIELIACLIREQCHTIEAGVLVTRRVKTIRFCWIAEQYEKMNCQ